MKLLSQPFGADEFCTAIIFWYWRVNCLSRLTIHSLLVIYKCCSWPPYIFVRLLACQLRDHNTWMPCNVEGVALQCEFTSHLTTTKCNGLLNVWIMSNISLSISNTSWLLSLNLLKHNQISSQTSQRSWYSWQILNTFYNVLAVLSFIFVCSDKMLD